jgi:hypothetical protein
MRALVKGDPEEGDIIKQSVKELVAGVFPHKPICLTFQTGSEVLPLSYTYLSFALRLLRPSCLGQVPGVATWKRCPLFRWRHR